MGQRERFGPDTWGRKLKPELKILCRPEILVAVQKTGQAMFWTPNLHFGDPKFRQGWVSGGQPTCHLGFQCDLHLGAGAENGIEKNLCDPKFGRGLQKTGQELLWTPKHNGGCSMWVENIFATQNSVKGGFAENWDKTVWTPKLGCGC